MLDEYFKTYFYGWQQQGMRMGQGRVAHGY
jgi:hypothetical protein